MELELQNWMFAFVRAGAFLLILPVFSSANVPVVVRIALAALAALIVAPNLGQLPPSTGLISGLGRLIVEAVVGLILGFTTRVIFGAFEVAGNLITTELGLNMSSMVNPVTNSSTQAPGMLLFMLASVLLFSLDLHHWLIAAFVKSYAVLPIGGAHLNEAILEHVVQKTGNIFVIAIQMAAPVMAVSFIVTLVFAVLGRAVPQMNVFSESFAVRAAAGLTVFGFTAPLIGEHMANALRQMPDDVMRVAQWLGTP